MNKLQKKSCNFSLEVLFKNSLSLFLNFADYKISMTPKKKKILKLFFHYSLAKTFLLKYFQKYFQIF
jgi:hypothetical protein